jgi:hypothetical protein
MLEYRDEKSVPILCLTPVQSDPAQNLKAYSPARPYKQLM